MHLGPLLLADHLDEHMLPRCVPGKAHLTQLLGSSRCGVAPHVFSHFYHPVCLPRGFDEVLAQAAILFAKVALLALDLERWDLTPLEGHLGGGGHISAVA